MAHTQLRNHSDWSLNLTEAHLFLVLHQFPSLHFVRDGWLGVFRKNHACCFQQFVEGWQFLIIWMQLLFKLERRGHHFRTL